MAKSVLRNNSDLKLRAEQVIDDAYMYGYEDGKKESTLHCWTTKEIEACEETYQRGYEDGVEHTAENFKYEISNTGLYNRGLKDAWECARKLCVSEKYGGLEERCAVIFGRQDIFDVFDYPVQEAMQKIKDYERKQKWAEQAKRGKEHRGEIEKMLKKRQKCDTCYHNETEFSVCQYCTDGNKYEERHTEDKLKCDTCEFESSQFNPCNSCVDNDEYMPKQTKDDYVDAIVKVRVPKWQIGEKVNLYFKDTMSMDGICERQDK